MLMAHHMGVYVYVCTYTCISVRTYVYVCRGMGISCRVRPIATATHCNALQHVECKRSPDICNSLSKWYRAEEGWVRGSERERD